MSFFDDMSADAAGMREFARTMPIGYLREFLAEDLMDMAGPSGCGDLRARVDDRLGSCGGADDAVSAYIDMAGDIRAVAGYATIRDDDADLRASVAAGIAELESRHCLTALAADERAAQIEASLFGMSRTDMLRFYDARLRDLVLTEMLMVAGEALKLRDLADTSGAVTIPHLEEIEYVEREILPVIEDMPEDEMRRLLSSVPGIAGNDSIRLDALGRAELLWLAANADSPAGMYGGDGCS